MLANGEFLDATTLLNTNQWVFDDVDGRYQVALLALRKTTYTNSTTQVTFAGPFSTRQQLATSTVRGLMHTVSTTEFASWSDDAAFPQIPHQPGTLRLFRKLRQHPRFDALPEQCVYRRWRLTPVVEMHATADKRIFLPDDGAAAMKGGMWPVYTGRSFNLWNPDTGQHYGSVDPGHIKSHLLDKRKRQHRIKSSAFSHLDLLSVNDETTLPCLQPRIAFRDVTQQYRYAIAHHCTDPR